MTPGSSPFEELEDALLRIAAAPPGDLVSLMRSGSNGITEAAARVVPTDETVLLLIDEFEALFTGGADEATQAAFVEGLTAAVQDPLARIKVVVTIRADFTDRPLRHPGFASVFEAATVMVGPLGTGELERAVVEPAGRVGVEFEPGLASMIVADVLGQPGALPLLQYALTELFEARTDRTLTLESYRQIGGVVGAIAQRAEVLLAELDDDARDRAPTLFRRLVSIDDEVNATRRRARRSELAVDEATDRVIAVFGRARLLSFDNDPATREPTVELAHEALISEWDRLGRWITEHRDELRLVQHLTIATGSWGASGNDPGELYRGGRLETMVAWAQDHGAELTAQEAAFLDASTAARDAEAERERRQVRRLRRTAVGVAVIALVALVAGVLAIVQRNDARDSRSAAETARLVAEAEDIAADDRSVGLLMAVEAYRRDPSPLTLGGLQRVFTAIPRNWLGSLTGRGPHLAVEAVAGARVAALGPAGLDVFALDDRRLVASIDLPGTPTALTADATGDRVVVGRDDGVAVVLDTDRFARQAAIELGAGIATMELSPDGRRLALGLATGRVAIVDTGTWVSEITLPGVASAVADLAWNPTSSRLLVAGGDGVPAREFDVSTGKQIGGELSADDLSDGSTGVAYSGDLLVVVNGPLLAFDADSGALVGDPIELASPVRGFGHVQALSDGSILGVNLQGQVSITDPSTRSSVLVASEPQVEPLDIEVVGDTIVLAGSEGLSLWSLDGRGVISISVPDSGALVSLSDSGDTVSVSDVAVGTETRVWDVDGGSRRIDTFDAVWNTFRGDELVLGRPIPPEAGSSYPIELRIWTRGDDQPSPHLPGVFHADTHGLSPDGRWAAHPVRFTAVTHVYDRSTGEEIATLDDLARLVPATAPPSEFTLWDAEFSPDSSRLVVTSQIGATAIWDTTTWSSVHVVERSGLREVAFTADGSTIVALDERGGLSLRDGETLELVAGPVAAHDAPNHGGRTVDITDDGRHIVTSGSGGARLWDATTLEPIGEAFPHNSSQGWSAVLATAGTRLATSAETVVVWDVETDGWMARACLAAGRNLTPDEWAQFGPRDASYRETCPNGVDHTEGVQATGRQPARSMAASTASA